MRSRARGSVTLWFLLTLTMLLAIGALAVDIPRVFAVTDELQNAADAAALAGAGALANSSTNELVWASGVAAATAAISLNASDGKQLSNGTVKAGYWDVAAASPTLLDPSQVSLPAPAGQMPEPAVQVTVTRDATHNGGFVTLLLGGLLGMPTTAGSATAVAIIAPPSAAPTGSLFPMVMDQCVYDLYWDSTTNGPVLDASGQPVEFQIGSGALNGSCTPAQWTSFDTGSNSDKVVSNLMTSGNTDPLSIGESIHVVTGKKTNLYADAPTNTTVLMPVSTQTATNSDVNIIAFAPFHIDSAAGGSGKYIQGHFVSGYTMPSQGSGVSSSGWGLYGSPRLAY